MLVVFIKNDYLLFSIARLSWVCADAEKLPFEDNTFDCYTIAFGIRNCTHIDQVKRVNLCQSVVSGIARSISCSKKWWSIFMS